MVFVRRKGPPMAFTSSSSARRRDSDSSQDKSWPASGVALGPVACNNGGGVVTMARKAKGETARLARQRACSQHAGGSRTFEPLPLGKRLLLLVHHGWCLSHGALLRKVAGPRKEGRVSRHGLKPGSPTPLQWWTEQQQQQQTTDACMNQQEKQQQPSASPFTNIQTLQKHPMATCARRAPCHSPLHKFANEQVASRTIGSETTASKGVVCSLEAEYTASS